MPNVELFGIESGDLNYGIIRKAIMQHIKGDTLRNVVFTLHSANVETIGRIDSPYIRITDTNLERAEEIADLFCKIIDVEILILAKFIPRKKNYNEVCLY